VRFRETPSDTEYREEFPGNTPADELDHLLRRYLHLDRSLPDLYARWSAADPHFAAVARVLPGMRLIRQEPVECLFSFICSSNNNIARIGAMIESLRRRYGTHLATLDGRAYFAFPSVDQLCHSTEEQLRGMGFGYRASYVADAARQLRAKGGEPWLLALRSRGRDTVRRELTQLAGVGPKVADCVALFSLDKLDCVPVDTHVWQIACRDYRSAFGALEGKTLSRSAYAAIVGFFRNLWGDCAGWANSVLYAADLPAFKHLLDRSGALGGGGGGERRRKKQGRATRTVRSEGKGEAKAEGGRARNTTADVAPRAERKPKSPPPRLLLAGCVGSKRKLDDAVGDADSSRGATRRRISSVAFEPPPPPPPLLLLPPLQQP